MKATEALKTYRQKRNFKKMPNPREKPASSSKEESIGQVKSTPSRKQFGGKPVVDKFPGWIDPMLATLVDAPFSDTKWIYEAKLDGERCIAYRDGEDLQLFSRNQMPLNATYPELVTLLCEQPGQRFIADGELVAFEPGSERSSFKEMQKRMHLKNPKDVLSSKVQVYYFLFDLLYFEGRDLRSLPVVERKKIMESAFTFNKLLRFNSHIDKDGETYFKAACQQGWEGLIAKRADSPYRSGRSRDWLKLKCLNVQEFVIGGYSDPQGARDILGALLIGYYENGKLRFGGKVGTGFNAKTLALVGKKLKPLEIKTCPFGSIDISRRGLHWVEPKLVAEIAFVEWTEEGKLRHPRFLGLRDDKPPEDVMREKKVPVTAAKASTPVSTSPKKGKGAGTSLKIDGKELQLTNLEKVFYPSTGFTKGQMLDYYIQIASWMVPHLKGRPVTMKRYPNGVEGEFFYEKKAPSYRPEWLDTFAMKDEKTGRVTEYGVINDMASLIWMANLACLEFHSLLARAPDVDTPTMITFDLDPGPPASLADCVKIALEMRDLLKEFKLQSFPKVSGGKGLHLYVPLNSKASYEQTNNFAHAIALLLEKKYPNKIVSKMSKDLRTGKILVDWSQNTRHKTTVTAYSLRAQAAPSVSAPVTWEEVQHAHDKKNMGLLRFQPKDVLARVEKTGDLFLPVQTLKQKLPKVT